MDHIERMAKVFSEAVAAQIAREMAVAVEPLMAAMTEGSKQTEAMNRTLQGAVLAGTMTATQEQEGMTAFPDATMIRGEDTCWHLADQEPPEKPESTTSTVHVAFTASLRAELVGHMVASTGWHPTSLKE